MAVLAVLVSAGAAHAIGDAPDEDTVPRERSAQFKDLRFTLHGYMRVRGDVFDDLDLSRGPTPSTGTTIFPTPAAGGGGHTITSADMRLRLEPQIAVGQAVRFYMRVDVLDNVGWGSTPDVLPSTTAESYAVSNAASPTSGINSLQDAIRVKRAWGEVALPFGVLSAGRMGALINWGTGFFVNNGDCLQCDNGDAGDRIALTVPLLGHLFTGLYELSASGPQIPLGFGQSAQADTRAGVNTIALAIAKYQSPEAQRRTVEAGRTLIQYGFLGSYRWQNLDAPAWVQGNIAGMYNVNDFVHRGLKSFSGDLWFLFHRRGWRWEIEAATVLGNVQNSSAIPGISYREPTVVRQWGGTTNLSYQFRVPVRLRAEVGVASGDPAPGFGVRFAPGQTSTVPGDFDGPQLKPPGDNSVDNFAFHPDYHVDLVLWRRIVGRVTDAVYVKPTLRIGPFGNANHHVTIDLSLIDSTAIYASTPPGQARRLGDEIDVELRYRLEYGFEAILGYGVFLPQDGFRNLDLHLAPKPAQVFEAVLAYRM